MEFTHEALQSLTVHQGYPCISLLFPTHRTRPDNERDAVVLKNLITEVENRLAAELDKRQVAALMEKLNALANQIDHNLNLDGMAVYVNADFADFFRFPFSVAERAIIDRNFAVRDVIAGKLRTKRYLVLVLSEQQNRLFEGYRDTLQEVRGYGFPANLKGTEIHKNAPMKDSADEDKARRENFNRLDKGLNLFNNHERLPVVLAATVDNLAKYQEVAARPRDIVATVQGNWDKTSVHDIGKRVWETAEQAINAEDSELLAELDAAVSARMYVSSIGEAYRLASERRGDALFVEAGYHEAGMIKDGKLTLTNDSKAAGVVDDVVDEVAELVYRYGGHVHFVPDGSLAQHTRIALTLRY